MHDEMGEKQIYFILIKKEASSNKLTEVKGKERLEEDEEGARERWGSEW